MKIHRYLRTIHCICLFLLLAACSDPDPLPTDSVGPMLEPPTSSQPLASNDAPRLVVYDCLKMDEGEFWLLDPSEEMWRQWRPDTSEISPDAVSGASATLLYYREKDDCLKLSSTTEALVLFQNGKTAVLPDAGFRPEPNHPRNLTPIISPDGRWRVRASSKEANIYSTRNKDHDSAIGRGGWVVDWSPDSARFLMSDADGSYIATIDGKIESLPESARKKTFQTGQWLSETEIVLIKDERLFHLDLTGGELSPMEGFGRVLWIRYAPQREYIATVERVDCVRKTDNSSWIIGTERCKEEIFLYDGDGQNRRRISAVDFVEDARPVWLGSNMR